MSVVVETSEATTRRLLITKAAPESILALSTAFEGGGHVSPLDPSTRQACAGLHEQLSADGLRVLAVAYRWVEHHDVCSHQDESDLVLAGFVSFVDPVVDGVADVLAELRRDGITVKILTGDNDRAARHLCRTIGIDDQIVTGDENRPSGRSGPRHLVEQASVFTACHLAEESDHSRAEAARARVGFMATASTTQPSLHTAEVGISVMAATDVAREAADIILGNMDLRVRTEAFSKGGAPPAT